MRGNDMWALVLLAATALVAWMGGGRHDVA